MQWPPTGGTEGQEVPLGTGRLQHILGVDADTIADQRDLVDQGDVDVALGIFENFGELGDADRWCAVGAGFDNRLINSIDDIQCLRSVARNNLQDIVEAPLFVPGIDALRRVSDVEIDLPFQTRHFF